MKKYLFAAICLLAIVGCNQNKGDAAGTDADSTSVEGQGAGGGSATDNFVLPDLNELNSQVDFRHEGDHFTKYAVVKVAGSQMLLLSNKRGDSQALFYDIGGNDYMMIASFQGSGRIEYHKHGVVQVVGCGSGCSTTDYVGKVEGGYNSILTHYKVVDSDGNVDEQTFTTPGGDNLMSEEEGLAAVSAAQKTIGKKVSVKPNWKELKQ
jgi:hypothetical protein